MIEYIGKEIEVIKAKLFSFLVIAGGSWVNGFSSDYEIINILAIILFIVVSYGVLISMVKLGVLENDIQEIKEKR